MSKSIKLKGNNYFDSKGVIHNKELLNDILNKTLTHTGEKYKAGYYDNFDIGIYDLNTFTGDGGENCPPDNLFGTLLVLGRTQVIISSIGIYYRINNNPWTDWLLIKR